MTISSAAQPAAPQASAPIPTAAARNDGNTDATGFAQALIQAGFNVPDPALPAGSSTRAQIPTGSPRNPKNAKQQSKTEDNNTLAAPVATPQPAVPALPLWIQSFSRETGDHEQPALAQAASTQPAGGRSAATVSAPEIPKPPAPESPQPAPASELAFAARVQPEQAAGAKAAVPSQPAQSAQHDVAALAPAAAKKTAASDAATPAVTPVAAGANASLASYGQGSENQSSPSLPAASSTSAPPSPVEAQFSHQAQPKPATAPVKDISFQVTQPGAQKVEVRVVQQSGELRVAVRTGDSDLAHGLQQNLSDLVGRLQETGSRAEAWRPGGTAVQSTPLVESHASASGSQSGDSQSYAGGSPQQDGERRQNQSQPRPGWVEELDNTIASGEQSQGVSYGIGS